MRRPEFESPRSRSTRTHLPRRLVHQQLSTGQLREASSEEHGEFFQPGMPRSHVTHSQHGAPDPQREQEPLPALHRRRRSRRESLEPPPWEPSSKSIGSYARAENRTFDSNTPAQAHGVDPKNMPQSRSAPNLVASTHASQPVFAPNSAPSHPRQPRAANGDDASDQKERIYKILQDSLMCALSPDELGDEPSPFQVNHQLAEKDVEVQDELLVPSQSDVHPSAQDLLIPRGFQSRTIVRQGFERLNLIDTASPHNTPGNFGPPILPNCVGSPTSVGSSPTVLDRIKGRHAGLRRSQQLGPGAVPNIMRPRPPVSRATPPSPLGNAHGHSRTGVLPVDLLKPRPPIRTGPAAPPALRRHLPPTVAAGL